MWYLPAAVVAAVGGAVALIAGCGMREASRVSHKQKSRRKKMLRRLEENATVCVTYLEGDQSRTATGSVWKIQDKYIVLDTRRHPGGGENPHVSECVWIKAKKVERVEVLALD